MNFIIIIIIIMIVYFCSIVICGVRIKCAKWEFTLHLRIVSVAWPVYLILIKYRHSSHLYHFSCLILKISIVYCVSACGWRKVSQASWPKIMCMCKYDTFNFVKSILFLCYTHPSSNYIHAPRNTMCHSDMCVCFCFVVNESPKLIPIKLCDIFQILSSTNITHTHKMCGSGTTHFLACLWVSSARASVLFTQNKQPSKENHCRTNNVNMNPWE